MTLRTRVEEADPPPDFDPIRLLELRLSALDGVEKRIAAPASTAKAFRTGGWMMNVTHVDPGHSGPQGDPAAEEHDPGREPRRPEDHEDKGCEDSDGDEDCRAPDPDDMPNFERAPPDPGPHGGGGLW